MKRTGNTANNTEQQIGMQPISPARGASATQPSDRQIGFSWVVYVGLRATISIWLRLVILYNYLLFVCVSTGPTADGKYIGWLLTYDYASRRPVSTPTVVKAAQGQCDGSYRKPICAPSTEMSQNYLRETGTPLTVIVSRHYRFVYGC